MEVFQWDFLKDLESAKNSILVNRNETGVVLQIAISSGDYGLEILAQIRECFPSVNKLMTVWSGHQFFKKLKEVWKTLNVIALPTYIISLIIEKEFQSKLVSTFGVAHNTDKDKIREAFASVSWNAHVTEKIHHGIKCIGIILGGSAPTPEGEMRYFSPEDPMRLAKHLYQCFGKEIEKTFFFVTNSPRTEPSTAEVFLKTLSQYSIPYQFVPFKDRSEYLAILGAVQISSGSLYVTGDSTMMLTETVTVLGASVVTAVIVGSVNHSHRTQMEEFYNNGLISLLDTSGKIIESTKMANTNVIQSAAGDVSAFIMQKIEGLGIYKFRNF